MSDEILDQATERVEGAEREPRCTNWLPWLQWVLTCALGFEVAGFLILNPSGWRLSGILGAVWLMEAVLWLVLSRRCFGTGSWMAATLVGLASTASATALPLTFIGRDHKDVEFAFVSVAMAVLGIAAGVLVGIWHWKILQPQVRGKVRWIWALAAAPVAGGFAAVLASFLLFYEIPWRVQDSAAALATGGVVYGLISGLALNALLPGPSERRDSRRRTSLAAFGTVLLSWAAAFCVGYGMLAPPVSRQHLFIQYKLGRRGFSAADLAGFEVRGANLCGADMTRANLSRADLSGANLSQADLSYADLRMADMVRADLSGASLSKANLSDSDLSYADLRVADMLVADLSGGNLSGTNLREADLSYADLRMADMIGADLRGANLSGTDLTEADLSGANLAGANLRGAKVTDGQLATAESFKGAIMPDGTIHP